MRTFILAALVFAAPVAAKAPDLSNIGPEPVMSEGIAAIEQAAARGLKDPDSAHYEWPHGFMQGWFRIPFGKTYAGWITCGTVNAKNAFGGYAGRTAIIGVINNGVANFELDPESVYGIQNGTVAQGCAKLGMPIN